MRVRPALSPAGLPTKNLALPFLSHRLQLRPPTQFSRRTAARENKMQRFIPSPSPLAVLGLAPQAHAEQVGKVGVDWSATTAVVKAIKSPAVDGVTCHVSYFDRGVMIRLQGQLVPVRPILPSPARRDDHHRRHRTR